MSGDFDSVLAEVGDFGTYQYIMYFLICIPASLPSAWNAFNQVFVAAVPDHWCHIPEAGQMTHIDQLENWAVPLVEPNRPSQCQQFDLGNTSYRLSKSKYSNDSEYWRLVQNDTTDVAYCRHGWDFDKTTYDSTIATEFNLVCDMYYWPPLCTMLFYLGSFIGNILFGYVADRWGRRPSFFIILMLQTFVGTANAFAPNIYAFSIMRSIVGLCFPALYQVPFIIGIELMGPSSRIFAGMAICVVFGSAMCLLGLVAMYIRRWSLLTIVCNAPFIVLFTYWFFLPESPRWLVSDGQYDKATKVLLSIAKWNKKPVDAAAIRAKCGAYILAGILIQIGPKEVAFRGDYTPGNTEAIRKRPAPGEEDRRHNLFDLFRTPNIRKITLLVTYIWFVNAVVYNGLTFNVSNLDVDDYVSFMINGAVEIPAYFITWPLLDRVGRRWPLCVSMLSGGVACICTMFVPKEYKWVISGLAFFGKFGIAASFAIIYIFAGELYPTVLRAIGMGMSSMVAGTGLLMAPYLVQLGEVSRILPLLIMGGLTISAGVLSMFLPETLGVPLPQTVLDSERFGGNTKVCSFPSVRRRQPTENLRSPEENALIDQQQELTCLKNGEVTQSS